MSTADKLAAILSGDIETILKLGPVSKVAGDTGRCAIGSEPGNHLVGADLIAIEACVGNWVADDEVELERWRRFLADRTNIELDPYRIEGLNAGFPEAVARSRGKVLSLAFQYMGGVPAFRNLAPHDFIISDDEIQKLKWDWRRRHKKIKDCWDALDAAAVAVVSDGPGAIQCGKVTFRCEERYGARCLYIDLPSGHSIAYPFARIIKNRFGGPAVTFKDNARGQWLDYRTKSKKKKTKPAVEDEDSEGDDGPEETRDEEEQTGGAYGGTWFENIVSGIARDLLADAMLRVEAAGYPVVLHVHDEVVSEVPDGFGSVEEYVRLVEQLPVWAQGIPVGAKGRNGPRFAKVEIPIEHVPGGFVDEPLPVKPKPRGEPKTRKKPAAKSANGASQESQPVSCLEAALQWAGRGCSVFPAPPGTKKSYKSGKRHGGARWGATKDPVEIERDWKRWPNANLGLPTDAANGFFVLEADTIEGHERLKAQGTDGIATLTALVAEHGPLPETLQGESPSGSQHYYFLHPAGAPIRSKDGWRLGIDIKGEGGMVIAPPSRKGDKAYRWLNRLPIAEAPQWLLELIQEGRERAPTDVAGPDAGDEGAGVADEDDSAPIEKTRLALEVLPHGADTDRKRWVSIGRILHRTYGEEGRALFFDWSRGGDYKPADGDEELERVWASFETDLLGDADPAKRIKIGSLYRWAAEADPSWIDRWQEIELERPLCRTGPLSGGAGEGGSGANGGGGGSGAAGPTPGPLPGPKPGRLPELIIHGDNLPKTAKLLAWAFARYRRFLFNGNEPIQVVHENNEMPRALAVNSASVRVFCHELCVPKKWNKKRGQIRQGDA
jgi:hypothetical protein